MEMPKRQRNLLKREFHLREKLSQAGCLFSLYRIFDAMPTVILEDATSFASGRIGVSKALGVDEIFDLLYPRFLIWSKTQGQFRLPFY